MNIECREHISAAAAAAAVGFGQDRLAVGLWDQGLLEPVTACSCYKTDTGQVNIVRHIPSIGRSLIVVGYNQHSSKQAAMPLNCN